MKNFFLLFLATSFFISCGQKNYGLSSSPESRAEELAAKLKAAFSFHTSSERTGLVFLKGAEETLTWRSDRATIHKTKKWMLHLDDKSVRLFQLVTTMSAGVSTSEEKRTAKENKDFLDFGALEIPKILAEDHNRKRQDLMNQLLELLKAYAEKNKSDAAIEEKDLLVVVTGRLRDLVGSSH